MLKFILLVICIVALIFSFDVLLPKIILKYRLHKEQQTRKEKQKAFRNKIKELEIK